jgi:hypothetical protein
MSRSLIAHPMRNSFTGSGATRLCNGHPTPNQMASFAAQQKDRLAEFGYATAKDGFRDLYDFKPEMKTS